MIVVTFVASSKKLAADEVVEIPALKAKIELESIFHQKVKDLYIIKFKK